MKSASNDHVQFLAGGGEMGTLIRWKDWSSTQMGKPENWPQSLRTTLSIMLHSKFPMFLWWGTDLICFYNDAYRPSLGKEGKHPAILGMRAQDAWPEIWDIIQPLIEQVLSGGESTWSEDQLIPIFRNGKMEDVYWTFSYSPVHDEAGKVAGVLVTCNETTAKVTTVHQLKTSEQRFRNLVNEATVATAVLTGEEMLLEMANDAALHMWGKDRTVLGKPLLTVFPELKTQTFPALLHKVYVSQQAQQEEEVEVYLTKNNKAEILYVDFTYNPLLDEKGHVTGIILTGMDVTEKVMTRKKLEESKDQLAFAIEAAELGTWDFNPVTNKFTSNNRLKEWFGLPFEHELDLFDALNAIAEKDRQRIAAGIQHALEYASGGQFDMEFTVQPPGKKEKILHGKGRSWFNGENIAYRFTGTLQDVTEEVYAKKKILESEKNLRLMILQAPVSIAIFRGADYVVDIVNARALELWGRSEEEVMNRPILQAMPELQAQGIKELLDNVYNTGNAFSATELPVQITRRGNLETAYINFVYEPLYDYDGNINGLMTVGFDVTEQVLSRKKVEESEGRVRTMVENAPFPIGVYVGREMRIALTNQAIMDVWGKGNNVVGKLYAEVLPELDNQAIYQQLDNVFTTGIPFHANNQQVDLVIDGHLRPYYFNYSFTPLFDLSGKVYAVMNTAADVTDLNIAKQKIEESEKRFRMIADSAPVLLWMTDTDKRYYFFNKAWLNFTGRSFEQEKDDGWMQGVHPDDFARYVSIYTESFDKREEFYVEYRLRRYDGQYRWISHHAVPRFTSDALFEGYIGACMDIHEQLVYQQHLKENEERLHIVIQASELGTWEWNLLTNEVRYSDRYLEIFGYSAGSVVDHRELVSHIHPDDMVLRNKAVATSLRKGNLHYEARIIRNDQSIHWIEAKGKVFYDEMNQPVKMVGTTRDISEEKYYQQELKEREEKFRLLADSIPQFIWTGDQSGRLDYFNQSLYNYTGLSAEEIQKNGWLQIVHPDERDENVRQWMESVHTGKNFIFEHRFRRADGEYRWQLSRAIPQKDMYGVIQMWVGTSTDIHDIKEQDQQKDYFISVASHELKTPITSIKGYTQILQDKYHDTTDAFLKSALGVIHKQVERLTILISDLLDVSKIKSGSLFFNEQHFQMNELVEEMINEIRHIYPNYGIAFLKGKETNIYADRERIGQVLSNLLTNAVKYSPGKNQINVETTITDSEIMVSVEDYGIGVRKEDQAKIFERFFRVEGKNEKTFPGFGIGLFICAEIIKRHKGKIGIKSQPGIGSVFYFTLPLNSK